MTVIGLGRIGRDHVRGPCQTALDTSRSHCVCVHMWICVHVFAYVHDCVCICSMRPCASSSFAVHLLCDLLLPLIPRFLLEVVPLWDGRRRKRKCKIMQMDQQCMRVCVSSQKHKKYTKTLSSLSHPPAWYCVLCSLNIFKTSTSTPPLLPPFPPLTRMTSTGTRNTEEREREGE